MARSNTHATGDQPTQPVTNALVWSVYLIQVSTVQGALRSYSDV
jgi:hypothetical protein